MVITLGSRLIHITVPVNTVAAIGGGGLVAPPASTTIPGQWSSSHPGALTSRITKK